MPPKPPARKRHTEQSTYGVKSKSKRAGFSFKKAYQWLNLFKAIVRFVKWLLDLWF